MRRAVILGIAAVLATVGVASAAVTTFAKAGSWTASGGTSDGGKQMCAVSSNSKGLWFGVKYFKGDNGLTVQISHGDWALKNERKVKVTMTFDRESPWSAVSTAFHMSDGDAALELSIPNKNITAWLKEFAASNSMVLRFPDADDIDDWRLDLSGSTAIVNRFGDCINAM